MKVVIQIPCLNEAEALPAVLGELPRSLPGVDAVEWLVIDDGSSDDTAAVARANGVDHVVSLPHNQGLARAFMAGLDACLRAGADIIVNTDADRQYAAADIPLLVAPIQDGKADMVIGARPIATTAHFSPLKKWLQRMGSLATSFASGVRVEDAASGFRAISRDLAMRLHVYNNYTYTVETIIQAGRQGMRVVSVPVRTNPDLRPSRLVRGLGPYVRRQLLTIVRVYVTYKPFRFFAYTGFAVALPGVLLGLTFLVRYAMGRGQGHIQSLILAGLLMGSGFILIIAGLLADLFSVNRALLERLDERLQLAELAQATRPSAGTVLTGGSEHGGHRR
jgi:glycosyltransferase involved in cell wall biosynthesis